MKNDMAYILFTEEQIQARVKEMGAAITEKYAGTEPVFVGILKGSFVFMADLMRAVDLKCSVDFMAVSSYGNGSVTTGAVKINKDLSQDIEGKHLVIMEDILDICPEDCLFVIDFNQYSNTAMKVLSYGQSRGAKIVLLTDRPTAPFACLADLLLLVDVDGASFFNSQVAAVFLLELLATLVADRNSEETERRLNVLNPYFDEHRLK